MLKNPEIADKQFALLSLEKINTEEEGILICAHLTGCDGKIREAASFRLNELFKIAEYATLLSTPKNFETMLEGLMDINGNVCRNILDIENEEFNEFLSKAILPKTEAILNRINELTADEKQYIVSKRNFQLYWALEAIYKVLDRLDFSQIEAILVQTAQFEDYTIQEKTAKILSRFEHARELKEELKQNSNYFVKRYLD